MLWLVQAITFLEFLFLDVIIIPNPDSMLAGEDGIASPNNETRQTKTKTKSHHTKKIERTQINKVAAVNEAAIVIFRSFDNE